MLPYMRNGMATTEEKMYELAYLASPDLNEADFEALKKTVNGLVAALGGSLQESSEGAKRRLAYPVKNKQGAYVVSQHIRLPGAEKQALGKGLRINEGILRFTLIGLTEKYLKRLRQTRVQVVQPSRQISQVSIEKAVKRQVSTPATEKPTPERQADISEIEKKLDEILSREF